MQPRCPAETRINKHHQAHTHRCQLDEGHEGAHAWRQDTREVLWFGKAEPLPEWTRIVMRPN